MTAETQYQLKLLRSSSEDSSEESEQVESQTDSGESSNDGNFFRNLIKKQERLMLGKKERKTNETKKEALLLSNRSTKPKLTAQHQYEPLDSSRGGSSEKSERVQVPSSNVPLLWRRKCKQNMEADFHRLAAQQTEEKSIPKAPSQEDVKEEKKNEKKQVSEKDEEEEQINISQTDSGESSDDDNFFKKLIKKQERLMLGEKECKTNETKKEDLLLSKGSTKPKLTAQQQYEPLDSSRGGSSEKSECVQVPRSNVPLLWRRKCKQNMEADFHRLEAQQTKEKSKPKAPSQEDVKEEKKNEKKQVSEKDEEEEQINIRMEHETLMKTAKDKQAADMKRTKALLGQEMEQFKSELDFQIQEENKKLKEDLEQSQRVNIQNWRKKYIADYKKKLADALQEVRVEMQQDHQKKVEMLRLDHLREINNIRQKYMDEESALRQSLLASIQEEREALQASHCEQLGSLRLQFDQQMEQMKLEHSQKTLNQRRQDNQLKQDLEKTTKDRWDMSRREEETRDKALKTGQAARPAQEQLEKRVEQLEKEYKHLASSLEMEMDKMKAANAQERVTSCKKMGSSLHLEDNEQALIHLQKVRSFLEGELCNVSGGKAKNEREETVEKMQRLQQEIKKEKEEKNGLRKEKKQLKKKIEQLEQRIEQLEKRAEHMDHKNNHTSDRLGVCNLHFGQSSGDINGYREALKVNSTKSWWDKHKRAL